MVLKSCICCIHCCIVVIVAIICIILITFFVSTGSIRTIPLCSAMVIAITVIITIRQWYWACYLPRAYDNWFVWGGIYMRGAGWSGLPLVLLLVLLLVR